MPEICRFLGIIIRMHYDDHVPPHFHAEYAGKWATVEIESLRLMRPTRISPRVLGLVLEWAAGHQSELREDWILARAEKPLKRIPPLE